MGIDGANDLLHRALTCFLLHHHLFGQLSQRTFLITKKGGMLLSKKGLL